MTTPELLAPAGAEAQLKAAVQSGADAVYMGGYAFNARHSAKNFTPDQMRDMIEYCHLYGVKTHIAINTLVKENELGELLEYAYSLNCLGADAFIIQDIGVAQMIKKALPDMELHASTQMTVSSLEGVRYLEDMGFKRVVLARELSKREIEYICKNAKAEIEVFVHGAICQCYSGQCLMSSILGGRSGNRGKCAQPCRLNYSVTENGKSLASGHLLSPKDMALINELQTLKEMGVASLKIEGRLKRAEYVSAVTGIYRKYLDFPQRVTKEDMAELKNAFSRTGFTDGYFTEKLGENMMSHKNPSNTENSFTREAKARAAENADIRKIPVNITASLYEGNVIEITAYDNDGNYVTKCGEIKAQKAINKPLDEERLKEQLSKLGGTPFILENIDVFLDEGVILPVKEINHVRRDALDELIKTRSQRDAGREEEFEFKPVKREKSDIILTASVRTKGQADAAVKCGIKQIYAPLELAQNLKYDGVKIIAKTPDIFKPQKTDMEDVLVNSPAAIHYYNGKSLYGDFRLNVYNSLTAEHLKKLKRVTVSPELTLREIESLLCGTKAKTEVIAYGRIPLMIMKNCPLKAAGKCQKNSDKYKLKDRKNEEFPMLCGSDCVCVLINSKPLFMADKLNDITRLAINSLRLSFTMESADECKRIIRLYTKALNGEKVQNPFGENEFTRGHFYRGV